MGRAKVPWKPLSIEDLWKQSRWIERRCDNLCEAICRVKQRWKRAVVDNDTASLMMKID